MNDDGRACTRSRGARRAIAAAVATLGLLSWSGAAMAAGVSPNEVDRAQADDGSFSGQLGGPQNQRSSRYQGPAGLYTCAQGRVYTYLARQACGGAKFPNRVF